MYEVLEKAGDAGVWLESVLWEDVAPYKYASHMLQVPEACKGNIMKAYHAVMAMQDLDFTDTADKLHLMMIIMLYAPVYKKNAKGQLMSAMAAVKSRLDRFNSGE